MAATPCPVCGQQVGLTPARGAFKKHMSNPAGSQVCLTSGTLSPPLPTDRWLRRWMRRHRAGTYVAFTVAGIGLVASVLGILDYLGVPGPFKRSSDASASAPESDVDPRLYWAPAGGEPLRSQLCDGVLGLCLGQTVSSAASAMDGLGPQTAGSPYPVSDLMAPISVSATCYGWDPEDLSVEVCSGDGASFVTAPNAVSELSVSLPDDPLVLSLPHGLDLSTGQSLTSAAESITEAFGYPPFVTEILEGEGYTHSFTWALPWEVEGSPIYKVDIVGYSRTAPQSAKCYDSEWHDMYTYSDGLAAAQQATFLRISVSAFTQVDYEADDLANPLVGEPTHQCFLDGYGPYRRADGAGFAPGVLDGS